jgi:hypothetical protein
MNIRILSAALLIAIPAAAAAQTPQERIDAARDRALAAGVPAVLIEAKIGEGMAKGVSMERLAAAIERRGAALERAREAMPGEVEAAELSVGADAIGVGVSEAVLTTLSELSEGSRRAVAIAALTQLVASGQVPEQALVQVTAALAQGGSALANLPAQAAAAAARRGPPAGVGGPTTPGPPGGLQVPIGPPAGVPAPGKKPTGKPVRTGPPVTPASGNGG